jgi:alpha-ketoglutarate-dependent taurine dioxygenase
MSGLQRSQSITADLDIRPLAGRIGAHIDNIHLAGDLPEGVIAAIEAVLSKYKVIFFRNPGHLDDAEQERFGAGSAILSAIQPRRRARAAQLFSNSIRPMVAAARTAGTPT